MSIAPIWTTLIDFLFIFLLVKLIQHSGLIWTRYGGIFIKSCAYFFFFYIHISCEYCRITCAKMWFYGQKRSTTWQHFCILRIENVWIQKQQQKQPWTHVLFLPSQWCLSPAHMFPQTGMHTHTRSGNTDIRGGAFWHADQGQQGLYDLWHCPTGHWALTAYATAPTYREINPHFISHICSTASKQTDSKTTKKMADVWLKKFQNWSMFGKRLYFLYHSYYRLLQSCQDSLSHLHSLLIFMLEFHTTDHKLWMEEWKKINIMNIETLTHRRKTEMRPQRFDNILCEVWLVRVPDKAYGYNLGGVHEDPSDPNPLPTVALEEEDAEKAILRNYQVHSKNFPSIWELLHIQWNFLQTNYGEIILTILNCFHRTLSIMWTMCTLHRPLTGQFRRSPIVLAVCNSSPNDSCLRWSICWLRKKRRIVSRKVQASRREADRQRQIKIKVCRERRKPTECEISAKKLCYGPVTNVQRATWKQSGTDDIGGQAKKVSHRLRLTRVRWWRHNAPAL